MVGNSYQKIGLSVLSVLILVIAFFPITQSGLFCDDIHNSQVPRLLIIKSMSLWDLINTIGQNWLFVQGRLMYVGFSIIYGMWDIVGDNLVLVKFFQLAAVLLNIFFFQKIITRISGTQYFGITFALLIIGFLQMRVFMDPILAFTFFLQAQTFFIIMAIVFFWNYLNTKHSVWLLLGSLIYMFYLATYELALMIPLILLGMNWFYNKTLDRKALLVYGVITALYMGLNIYLRTSIGVGYDGAQLGTFGGFFKTYLIQTSATLPLAYSVKSAKKVLVFSKEEMFIAIFLSALVFYGLKNASKNFFTETIKYRSVILWISCVMIFFPPLILAFSSKYQKVLIASGFGMAYLPVYIQSFGLCGVTTVFWNFIGKKLSAADDKNPVSIKKRFLYYFLLLIISIIVGFTFAVNRGAVEKYNQIMEQPLRSLMETSLKSGLLKHVPEGSIILRDQYKLWEINAGDTEKVKLDNFFYFGHSGKRVKIFSFADFISKEKDENVNFLNKEKDENNTQELDLKNRQIYILEAKKVGDKDQLDLGRVLTVKYKQENGAVLLEEVEKKPLVTVNAKNKKPFYH